MPCSPLSKGPLGVDTEATLENLLSEHGRRAFGDEGEKVGSHAELRGTVVAVAAAVAVVVGSGCGLCG